MLSPRALFCNDSSDIENMPGERKRVSLQLEYHCHYITQTLKTTGASWHELQATTKEG
jgi:hypothetical protein